MQLANKNLNFKSIHAAMLFLRRLENTIGEYKLFFIA